MCVVFAMCVCPCFMHFVFLSESRVDCVSCDVFCVCGVLCVQVVVTLVCDVFCDVIDSHLCYDYYVCLLCIIFVSLHLSV